MKKITFYFVFVVLLVSSFNTFSSDCIEFRRVSLPVEEYDSYYMNAYPKINGGDFWVYEKSLPLMTTSNGDELGIVLPHLIIINKNEDEKIGLVLENHSQSITYKNIRFSESLLKFDIFDIDTKSLIGTKAFEIIKGKPNLSDFINKCD